MSYIVVTPIEHDNLYYPKSFNIELTDAQAAPLLKDGVITVPKPAGAREAGVPENTAAPVAPRVTPSDPTAQAPVTPSPAPIAGTEAASQITPQTPQPATPPVAPIQQAPVTPSAPVPPIPAA